MPTGEDTTGFSARELRYLRSLPAVEHVSRKRITYAPWFKLDCMKRYAAGGSPVHIFREAGLDPSMIGYKRIERCFARWRTDIDINAPEHAPEHAQGGHSAAGAGSADAGRTADEHSVAGAGSTAAGSAAGMPGGTAAGSSTSGAETDASGHPARGKTDNTDNEELTEIVQEAQDEGDVRGLIITQQARRIDALEQVNQQLRATIRELETEYGEGSNPGHAAPAA